MKKILHIICCALGIGIIGFFANQLNTVCGCVMITFGVAMLVASIVIINKDGEGSVWNRKQSER